MDYIIKNGRSDYSIIYPDNYSESEFYAAGELSAYLQKVTGVILPVLSESNAKANINGKFISVGQTKLFTESGFNIEKLDLNGDGYVIKTKNSCLFLNGLTPRGKIYSVYGYLEMACGIKFLDVEYEYIPTLSALEFEQLNVVEIPSFFYRGALSDATYHFDRDVAQAFAAKRGITHEFLKFDDKFGGTVNINTNTNQTHNNLTYVFKDTEYCKLSREDKVKRFQEMLSEDASLKNLTFNFKEQGSDKTMYNRDYPTDICYTDGISEDGEIEQGDNTASRYLEGLKHYITLNPNAEYYVCGQEDVRNCCDCERCKASNALYGGTCGTVIRFYNAIARAIQAWADGALNGKKIKIMIFSYYFTAVAPVKKQANGFVPVHPSVVLEDNIVIRFADITANYHYSFLGQYHSDLKPEQLGYGYGVDYLEKWRAVAPNNEKWYWGYTTNHSHYFTYCSTMAKLDNSLKGLSAEGCKYVLLQHNTTEHKDFKAVMETYISAKMLWNANLKTEDVRQEFITYYYGELADDIRDIIANFEGVYQEADKVNAEDAYWDFFNMLSEIYHIESYLPLLDKVNQTLKKAENILDQKQRERLVVAVKLIKLYPLYSIMNLEKKNAGESYVPTNYAIEFFNLCDQLGVKDYGEHLYIRDMKKEFKLN